MFVRWLIYRLTNIVRVRERRKGGERVRESRVRRGGGRKGRERERGEERDFLVGNCEVD